MASWVKGQSDNPAGRPRGSRDRLTEKVYKDIVDHWAEHGISAIEKLYETRPDLYVAAVVRLIPMTHQVAVEHRRSAVEFSTQELPDMRAKEHEPAIEHQPEAPEKP